MNKLTDLYVKTKPKSKSPYSRVIADKTIQKENLKSNIVEKKITLNLMNLLKQEQPHQIQAHPEHFIKLYESDDEEDNKSQNEFVSIPSYN
jgi:hypothetical protein